MKFSISVIIPNYNGRKLLEENLPSVISAMNFSCIDYEIIIFDDASTDDSVAFLKEKHPQITILTNAKNSGFSSAANRGIREAKKQLTLLLNSDVKLKEDYLTNQFRFFEKPDTFGVMGSICSPDGKLIDAAKYPQWSGSQIKSTLNFSLPDAPEDFLIPTYFLSGANALTDTKKLRQLGGFNEIYSPFYMEDVDLAVLAWRMGWKCYYEPKAICYHNISQTIKKHNSNNKVKLISKRNKFIFHEIHLSGSKKLFWKTEMLFNLIFRWLALDFDYYRAFMEFRKRKQQIKLSIIEFNNLHPVKTLEQIVREIQNGVEGIEKRLF